MSRVGQIAIAAGTFCAAISIGMFVQYNSATAARSPLPTPAILGQVQSAPVTMPRTPDAGDTAILPAALKAGQQHTTTPLLPLPSTTDQKPAIPACDIVMDAAVTLDAQAVLDISAPCHGDKRATLHHRGMMVSILTDAEGNARITIPALAVQATYVVAFDDGEGAYASVNIPEVAQVHRAVLQWQGDDGLSVHAYEFGADFADPGHVWSGAVDQGQGTLATLGDVGVDAPLRAEIYTFPAQAAADGDITLTVEAQVTQANCNQDVAAQSLQIAPGKPVKAVDLVMTMPNCDAVSDILVLKNMFEDLKLAAR